MSRFITAIFIMSLGSYAHSLPLKHKPFSVTIPNTFTTDYNFEGIVALDDCSGSLVRFENSKDTDDAMVLTNGHCIETGFPQYGTFVSHQASSRSFQLMNQHGDTVGTLLAAEVIYSTMTKTDVTLYKLRETYASILQQYNVHSLTIASTHPALKAPIEVISGYWQRGYSCNIDAFVYQLKEADWVDQDSIRYSNPGCEVIAGTSGSPIVAAGTRTVIGINNTGNENGERCTEDNPCEIDQNGNVSFQKGLSYGQETYWFYSCLNANNEVDLTVNGCQLFH